MPNDMAAGSIPIQDFDVLRDDIRARYDSLPKRLAQVADAIMAAPDDFTFGTVSSVAAVAGVQPSTIIRFARAFGFHGFSDMQVVFRERLRGRASTYQTRLDALRGPDGASPPATMLLEGFAHALEQSLTRLRAGIDAERLERACAVLAEAETLFVLGLRRSAPVADYLSYLLNKLSIRHVDVRSATGMEDEIASFATHRDAAIVISYSPYARRTIEVFNQFQAVGVPTIVLTDSPFSPVVPAGGLWFEILEQDFQGFRSNAAATALVMTLATSVAKIRDVKGRKR
ncbi:MurR/RpiR family transcriptional regulator [Gluconacetobacter diazotrophicus]|uniref:MurR/RpiR family transcriptional regulator n=2 Tax=Gluconacetobacter diazotrophicus TaxID=33996 RepID=A0A7W4I619_GLUDI|nr:MurR/RpiR family transcriptional regulator [Gluconacetobacter diazotrophicus]MBB2156924.1 MurR/RpiR family transcriptional regulator [Gluconacetobacter diazotrophicus]CAP54302.1 putative sugar isomerase [Gluconacetobacter diazotrophicus PA1 5]